MKTPLLDRLSNPRAVYNYDDTPGRRAQEFFRATRFWPNGVGTYILRAANMALRVAGADGLPAGLDAFRCEKTSGHSPKYYPVLAKYFIRFLEEYKKRGIVVDYLSLFNEPEESTQK